MRIIAGAGKGRRIDVPRAVTRPTSARVREALFAMLTHQLGTWDDVRVLDIYAGSGAFGLEALSRGAASARFVERDPAAARICRANLARLALPGGQVSVADARNWLARSAPEQADCVFADPPYDTPDSDIAKLLRLLADRQWLAAAAVVVIERSRRSPPPHWPGEFADIWQRRFGDTVAHGGRYRHRARCADTEGAGPDEQGRVSGLV